MKLYALRGLFASAVAMVCWWAWSPEDFYPNMEPECPCCGCRAYPYQELGDMGARWRIRDKSTGETVAMILCCEGDTSHCWLRYEDGFLGFDK